MLVATLATALTLAVSASGGAPGYELEVATDELGITTRRGGRTLLATDGVRFRVDGDWRRATRVTSWRREEGALHVEADTTAAGHTVRLAIRPRADRYALTWSVAGPASPDRLGLDVDLASAGHWYGHGETPDYRRQPWPLDAGEIHDAAFGPASYLVVNPFWFTSSAVGLWVDTESMMDVEINAGESGLGRFTIEDADRYSAIVFVESAPLDVYRDYVAEVGGPAKADVSYEQVARPVWNSWAQLYSRQTQENVLGWARGLEAAGLGGHAVQIEESVIAPDFRTRFGDLRGLSDELHRSGSDLGMWTGLYVPEYASNFAHARARGYLLEDPADPGEPCLFTWWNGRRTGLIDLANPAAREWYVDSLHEQMRHDGVDGFKFDTSFFDERCAPYPGHDSGDYVRLGAELADEFDQQGVGIRIPWSGGQRYGFVTRTVDKGKDWASLRAATNQALTLSSIGYPFVETDMIGGSPGEAPPAKEVLVRWAQAAALMPLMYASTSPVDYDAETVALYRAAIERHERLAPYIWEQVQRAVETGDPIMRPLLFEFPEDDRAYSIADQWMLGPAVLAAPALDARSTRDVHLPAGRWYDVNQGTVIRGPRQLTDYAASLGVTPAFVRLGAPGAEEALRALKRDDAPAAGLSVEPERAKVAAAAPFEVAATVTNWGRRPLSAVDVMLSAPEGWIAEPVGATRFDRVRGGGSVTARWRVTVPARARWTAYHLSAHATHRDGDAGARSEVTVPPEPGDLDPAFRTLDTTPEGAEYGQTHDQVAIWAGGRDWSGGYDEKAAIYRDAVLPENGFVSTRVVSHGGGGPASKAGIVVANDLADPVAGGYAMLVMSRDHGAELMWDSDGDGRLDGWKGGGSSQRPVWLKLERSGDTFTGSISGDGETWNEVGTVVVPSAEAPQDAGVAASAVNLFFPGERANTVFDSWAPAPADIGRLSSPMAVGSSFSPGP